MPASTNCVSLPIHSASPAVNGMILISLGIFALYVLYTKVHGLMLDEKVHFVIVSYIVNLWIKPKSSGLTYQCPTLSYIPYISYILVATTNQEDENSCSQYSHQNSAPSLSILFWRAYIVHNFCIVMIIRCLLVTWHVSQCCMWPPPTNPGQLKQLTWWEWGEVSKVISPRQDTLVLRMGRGIQGY